MNRINDALILLNKIMNESETNQTNSDLYVLRARLHMKLSNVRIQFYLFFCIRILNCDMFAQK